MSTDVVVVGLGYVGLPLAERAMAKGLSVRGLDVNTEVVQGLNAGRSHILDVSDEAVTQMVAHGFVASADPATLDGASTVVITVPTPLREDHSPDTSFIQTAADMVASHLSEGMLVCLESTSYPGTTEEVLVPRLETSGLKAGIDFHVAFSSERVDPGNRTFHLGNTPKVVGGLTETCLRRASAFYGKFVDEIVEAQGLREAEMSKLIENTYRHVNIALVNEIALICADTGIDVWEALRCAATKPFGYQAFMPGPGIGGHCIPIDPHYLRHFAHNQAGRSLTLVEAAHEVHERMGDRVVQITQDALNDYGRSVKGARITIAGVAYKQDVPDDRESPAVPIARRLRELGADIAYVDPYFETWVLDGEEVRRIDDLADAVASSEVVVLLQGHTRWDLTALASESTLLVDTRNVLRGRSGVHRL